MSQWASLSKVTVVCYPQGQKISVCVDPFLETARSLIRRLFWAQRAPFSDLVANMVDEDDLYSAWTVCTEGMVPLRSQTRPLASVMHVAAYFSIYVANTIAPFKLRYFVSGANKPQTIRAMPFMQLGSLIERIDASVRRQGERVEIAPGSMWAGRVVMNAHRTLVELGIGTCSSLAFIICADLLHKDDTATHVRCLNVFWPLGRLPFVIYYNPLTNTPAHLRELLRKMALKDRGCWVSVQKPQFEMMLLNQTGRPAKMALKAATDNLAIGAWLGMRATNANPRHIPAIGIEWKA